MDVSTNVWQAQYTIDQAMKIWIFQQYWANTAARQEEREAIKEEESKQYALQIAKSTVDAVKCNTADDGEDKDGLDCLTGVDTLGFLLEYPHDMRS